MNNNSNKNTSSINQASRRASQRSRNAREDSTMQSEHNEARSRPSPMRAASSRLDNQEFRIAGEVHGGTMRQKNPTSKSAPIVDSKGFVLPLDKAVAKEMVGSRKEQEAVNHLHQTLEHNVRVGLNKPTLTVFSSIGGGRNSSSTEIEFGGPGSKKVSGNAPPKEFEYRDEDFQPLSAQSNTKQRASVDMSMKTPGTGQRPAPANKKGGFKKSGIGGQESSAYHGLTSSLFKEGIEADGSMKPHLYQQHQQQKSVTAAHERFTVSAGHQDVSGQIPSSQSSKAPTQHTPSGPSRHEQAVPIHQSAMPPVHHSSPAHHPAPDYGSVSALHMGAGQPLADPMHPSHAVPIYHGTPLATDLPHAKPRIEVTHGPSFVSSSVSPPSIGDQNIQHPVNTTSKSAVAPAYEIPMSTHKRVQVLGMSHDEPISQPQIQANSSLIQTEATELNAASYPSFSRHSVESEQIPATHKLGSTQSSDKSRRSREAPVSPRSLALKATQAHPPKKLSKRERKAAKRSEAAKNMSVLDSISSALVGRRKNSVSIPVMQLNEIFEPQEQQAQVDSSTGVAAGLGGIRSMLGSIHMPSLMSHHPADVNSAQGDGSFRLGAASSHDYGTTSLHVHRRVTSKAAALKVPKINLALFPEEQADYPRGNTIEHENPARPKVVRDVIEKQYHGSSLHHPERSTTAAAGVPRAPLGHMILDLHSHQDDPYKLKSQSAQAWSSARLNSQQKSHSTAAALKKPKFNLSLFPEEEACYSRSDGFQHANQPGAHANLVEVKEIQLDAGRRHAHHDLHPTVAETAATAVTSGLEGLKSIWDGMHGSSTGAGNPAAAAVLSTMATAAMHHVPSVPAAAASDQSHEVDPHRYKDLDLDLSLAPEEDNRQRHQSPKAKSKKSTGSLPLMYGTPVDSSHQQSPVASTKREQHQAISAALPTTASPVTHAAPASSSVYSAEPAAQYHTVAPKIVSVPDYGYSSRMKGSTGNAMPIRAAAGATSAIKEASMRMGQPQQQHHGQQQQHGFVPSEHHCRRMEIHCTTDEVEERYFPADDWQSPAMRNTPTMGSSSKGMVLKPKNDPLLLLARRTKPLSVLPPSSQGNKSTMIAGPIHASVSGPQHQRLKQHQMAPVVGGIAAASVPLATVSAAGVATSSQRQQQPQTEKKVPVAKIPIAKPPVQATTPKIPIAKPSPQTTAPKIPIAQPPVMSSSQREPLIDVKGQAARSTGLRMPGQYVPSKLAHGSSAPSVTVCAAASLMAASAARVNSDDTLLMKTGKPDQGRRQGEHQRLQDYIPGAYVYENQIRDSHARTVMPVAPVDSVVKHHNQPHHTYHKSAAIAGAAAAAGTVPILAAAPRTAAPASHAANTPTPSKRSTGPETRVMNAVQSQGRNMHANLVHTQVTNASLGRLEGIVTGQTGLAPDENIMMRTTTTTKTIPNDSVADPSYATAARLGAGRPIVIPGQHAGEDVIIQARTLPKSSARAEDPLSVQQQSIASSQSQLQQRPQSHAKEAIVISSQRPGEEMMIQSRVDPKVAAEPVDPCLPQQHHQQQPAEKQQAQQQQHQQKYQRSNEPVIIPTQHTGVDIIAEASTTPNQAGFMSQSSSQLHEQQKQMHQQQQQQQRQHDVQTVTASTAAAAVLSRIHRVFSGKKRTNDVNETRAPAAATATHSGPQHHHYDPECPMIVNVAAPTAESILASSASFDPAANANAGIVKPASISLDQPTSLEQVYQQRRFSTDNKPIVSTTGARSRSIDATHISGGPVPAPRPTVAAASTAASASATAAVPIVPASDLRKEMDTFGYHRSVTTAVEPKEGERKQQQQQNQQQQNQQQQNQQQQQQQQHRQYRVPATLEGISPVRDPSVLQPSISAVAPVSSIHTQQTAKPAIATLSSATTATALDHHHQQQRQQTQPQPTGIQVSSRSSVLERPMGYEGPMPMVKDGETLMWVKKTRTTQFYDLSDEDDQELDEFGYRKDRDVSLHMPLSRNGSRDGSFVSSESQGHVSQKQQRQEEQRLKQHYQQQQPQQQQQANAGAMRRGLAL
ncbi:hypothetical protein BGX28_003747 [Mortierella sp. GBA30]|nr:hypothetical protein BGX28_003747 [Mortierella sp. GBA30]